jgi:hypothetical protein
MEADAVDYESLDEGVREVVAFLREKGFNTTDSGDGTKTDMDCALPYPHVFIFVEENYLTLDADTLLNVLVQAGVEVQPGDIGASYDPHDKSAVLMLFDAENRWMKTFKRPTKETR